MRAFLLILLVCLSGWAVQAGEARQGPEDAVIVSTGLPTTLSDFGFFADTAGTVPAKGVIPYRLNSPLFSDYAEKYRFIYIPKGMSATANGDGLIDFPVGSALIKSFGYEQDGKTRLLETRVLLHRADGWLALPYVWNEAQTEAVLKVAGTRIPVSFRDPAGRERSISYAVPNKNQCKECHALSGAVTPIGPKLRNLDPSAVIALTTAGQITGNLKVTSAMPDFGDGNAPLNSRARAYLDVNCAHCHNRQGSASNSGLFLEWDEKSAVHLGIGKRPVAAGRGSGNLEFAISPGHPDQSIMLFRMNSLDPGIAMPEVGRGMVHDEGVKLLSDWIAAMDDS
jgi:uncharacterized repeat protein (TIGR03806 family)